ncbi:MAG: ATP-binding protein [Longimicrobiales bacterium]
MKPLSLRNALIGTFFTGVLYVVGMVSFLALSVLGNTREALEDAGRLAEEFEALGARADTLNRALVEFSRALGEGQDPPDRMIARGWVAAVEDRAIGALATLPGIPPDMRRNLSRAGDLESTVTGLLNEALAQYEQGLVPEARETVLQAEAAGRELTNLLVQAQVAGLQLLLQRQEAVVAAGRRLRNLTLLWALVGAVLAGFALFWFHARVYGPFREVEQGLTRVGAGEYDKAVPVVREDELGRLAEILNWAMTSLRQRAEEQARVTRGLMERVGRLMEDSGREIYIFHSDNLHLVQMNGTLRENLGWGPGPLDEKTPSDFLLPEESDDLRNDLPRLRGGEIPNLPITLRHRRADGSTYPVEGHIHYSGEEEPAVFVAVVRDMTQIYDREDRLRQAMKMQAVGQLTGGVAHDFNNLLTVIQGSLNLLEDAFVEDDARMGLLEDALTAAERGASLTHQLLAFSRKQALRPRAVDLSRLVGGMDGMLRRTLGEDVEIDFVTDPDLWRCHADPTELQNVILNLSLNARDAMPQGGKLTIEAANVRLDESDAMLHDEVQPGQYVRLAVTDTGKGMSPGVLARAFDPFFTTKGVGEGSGLGLSMAFGFASQSGGHMRLESEEGKGTTVDLYLPRLDAEEVDPNVREAAEEPQRPEGRGERILVVEDDPDVLDTATTALEALGYETRAAVDADSAAQILRSEPPGSFSLLFTDVVLRGSRSGRDLAREAREYDPGLPVLFTSGYTEDAIIHNGRLEPGVHLLTKPYWVGQLAQKVKEVMGGEE